MGFWGSGRWASRGDVVFAPAPAVFQTTDLPVLSQTLVELGLQIVQEGRGPMRLWDFSRRLGSRLGMPPLPLPVLSEAVKSTLSQIDHPRLRLLAPGMPGVGYVYDADDPETVPIRSSR